MKAKSAGHDAEPLTLRLAAGICLPDPGAIVEAVALDGRQVCLARLDDGELIAFEARCPHRGVPLCQGILEGGTIICLEHFWRWQCRSGAPVNPGHGWLRTYRVDSDGDGSLLTLRSG